MSSLFRNANFARLFAGRVVTNAGDSLYYVASMWLVYDLTGSSFYTGLAGFLVLAPSAFQFLFGPLVDRVSLRRLLVGTQLTQAVVVLTVPLAFTLGYLNVWVVLAVMPILSLLNQPVYPAQSAALPRLVERDELVRANSLFALAYQGIDAGFNALGGVLVAVVGATALFVLDAATFVAAAALFAGLRVRAAGETSDSVGGPEDAPDTAEPVAATDGGADETAERPDGGEEPTGAGDDPTSYVADLREGIAFLRGTVMGKVMLGSVVVNGTFGAALAVLPAYGDMLGGEIAYGLLTAGVGGGLFVGALAASRFEDYAFGWLNVVSFLVGAVLWAAAVTVGWFPGTVALLALALVPVGVTNVLFSALVQSLVPEAMLGRASAVMGSMSSAATPVGALLGGAAADAFGVTVVLYVTAAGLLGLAVYLASIRQFRRLPRISDVETLAVE
ncbi:MFS transporter [Halomarina salina]|uniref:MFS transporter n=1 Tax=Halomarina salina TaxID=1872699 RepID=A0ABD5RLW4_9EURY|nr:MFS transporter [Halomarina salina]